MNPNRLLAFLRELKIPALIGLACLGAVLALIPAWLPQKPHIPIEQHSIEILQVVFLALSSILFFAASAHSGRYAPPYRIMAYIVLAAVIAELASGTHTLYGWNLKTRYLLVVPLVIAVSQMLRHSNVCLVFLRILTRRAGAGILATALLINYIFTPIFGSSLFWQATLGDDFTPHIPDILKSYLQLFSCYLVLVGATSLSLNHPRTSESLTED